MKTHGLRYFTHLEAIYAVVRRAGAVGVAWMRMARQGGPWRAPLQRNYTNMFTSCVKSGRMLPGMAGVAKKKKSLS